jgi:hypothetical protein
MTVEKGAALALRVAGIVEFKAADGTVWRSWPSAARSDNSSDPARAVMHYYVAPDFRSRAKTIRAADVVAIVNGDLENEVSELSRILLDHIKHPHPLAAVRDAARAKNCRQHTHGN